MPKPDNVFSDIPAELSEELTETLVAGEGFRVERIVSRGHASPPGFWYEQDEDEWVLLLAGAARLRLAAEAGGAEERTIDLRPGDHLRLPARRRHRVEWTDPERETVWLAVWGRLW